MNRKTIAFSAATGIGGVLIITWIGLWIWLVTSSEPLRLPIVQYPLWPVACSTKGCVSYASWNAQHQQENRFAALTEVAGPTPAESLTNLLRRHLVHNAFLQSAVTEADATRYREVILRLEDNGSIEETLGISVEEYDKNIVLPFLEQEALRIQHNVESTEELYGQLTQERFLVLLSTAYSWEQETGTVRD